MAHDATQLNRQGNDVGTQYRSAIFPQDSVQFELANSYMQQLVAAHIFLDSIATTIEPGQVFYPAEKYHQNYYNQNSSQGYCQMVIAPKLEKLRKYYKSKLK